MYVYLDFLYLMLTRLKFAVRAKTEEVDLKERYKRLIRRLISMRLTRIMANSLDERRM
jgi:hypothetical protein